MRTTLAALALIVVAAHLAFLSPTLEDIDSINFALGVREFNVAQHQPHPPGSPVFIALGKASTAVARGLGVPGAESRALAFWSVVAGGALIPLAFLLFESLDGDRRRAFWAAALAALAPLAWFTTARPRSDAAGLALAVCAQGLMMAVWTGRAGAPALLAGGFVAGLAAGVRVQTAFLTLPLIAVTLASAPRTVSVRSRLLAVAAAAVGALVWAVPLVIQSGGMTSYVAAFGSQAGEDLAGVRMLWTTPQAKVAYHAFVNSFVWPWGVLALGIVVLTIAFVGVVRTAWTAWPDLIRLAVAFGPYAVFHLVFQETTTMRYALPLVVPMAYLVVRGAEGLRVSPFLEIGVVAAGLYAAVPPTTAFGRGSPGFAAMREALAEGGVLSGHAGMRRLWEWSDGGRTSFLRAPHGYEWLTLVEHWQKNPEARIQFLANPKRTDHVTLFDPQARSRVTQYAWPFPEWPYLGGARPGAVTRILFIPPNWMLDRGWATNAEILGITERDGYGPHRKPSVAWIRGRRPPMTLLLGGRHLGAAGDPEARVNLDLSGAPLEAINIPPGYFFRTLEMPAADSPAAAYVPLAITSAAAAGGAVPRVSLEQFDLQPPGVPMRGFSEGWYEPEYNRTSGRAWRWTSERSTLWVRPVGRDVTLTMDAESPIRYFDAAPQLRLTIGGTEIARLSPSADFRWDVRLPAAALASAGGRVLLESDKWFVPGDRDGTGDRRHLALRVYSVDVR